MVEPTIGMSRRARRTAVGAAVVAVVVLVLLPVLAPVIHPMTIPVGGHDLIVEFTDAARVPVPIPQGRYRWPSRFPQTVWTYRFGSHVYFLFWQQHEIAPRLNRLAAAGGRLRRVASHPPRSR